MVAEKQKTDIIITQLLERCEIHRKGLALLPDQADKRPGLAFLVFNEFNSAGEISCSCRITGKGACTHIADLKRVYASLDKDRPFDHEFRNGIWYQIASILMDGKGVSLENISLKKISRKTGHIIIAKDNDKNELMRYFAGNHDAERLVERCIGLPKEANETIVPTRNLILNKLYKKTQTLNERIMLDRGFKTRGQILEESFWFRMAYHAWRELGNVDFLMTPAIDKKTGAFTVICKNREDNPVMSFSVPRKVVKKLLVTFRQLLPNQNSMPIQPVPLKSIFNIDINTELDLEVRPVI
ncbi:MAG: hypothetical protein GX846_07730, partial [Deltaproteobacteria bacterium]|nr:hypothetical protein [Deltaproteobacteria bacterium]